MALAIDKNMIDKDEYPQTAEIERRCVHMLADLWNAPDAANSVGRLGIGSSEACMLAGMAAKWRWRARRRAAGKPRQPEHGLRPGARWCGTSSPVLGHRDARGADVTGHVHAWTGLHARAGRREHDHGRADLGVTYTGAYELVEAMSEALDQLQADTGLDIDIHVDGGQRRLSRPVLRARRRFDFRLPGSSRSAPRAQVRPGPAGRRLGRLARCRRAPRRPHLPRHYLGGDMPVFQINFSRPAGRSSPVLQLPAPRR
jgi:glutamate decarboxylase